MPYKICNFACKAQDMFLCCLILSACSMGYFRVQINISTVLFLNLALLFKRGKRKSPNIKILETNELTKINLFCTLITSKKSTRN